MRFVRISVPIYGLETWGDLFTPRQALALTTLAQKVSQQLKSNVAPDIAEALQTCMALVVDRQANTFTSVSRWNTAGEKFEVLFHDKLLEWFGILQKPTLSLEQQETGMARSSGWKRYVYILRQVLKLAVT